MAKTEKPKVEKNLSQKLKDIQSGNVTDVTAKEEKDMTLKEKLNDIYEKNKYSTPVKTAVATTKSSRGPYKSARLTGMKDFKTFIQ